MKAKISTKTGTTEIYVSASYQYKGIDVFLVLTGFNAYASEWSTGCRITMCEFDDVIEDDNEAILAITEKTNTVLDRAAESGELLPTIENMIKEIGIVNQGPMPIIGVDKKATV